MERFIGPLYGPRGAHFCQIHHCVASAEIMVQFYAAFTHSGFEDLGIISTNSPTIIISLPPKKDTKLKDLQDRVHKERKERVALEAKIEQLT